MHQLKNIAKILIFHSFSQFKTCVITYRPTNTILKLS
nr:MAG TPA: AAA-ATPase Vps4-associated protein 1 [Caudoviricetes sp.]